jgi:hypothetical protein
MRIHTKISWIRNTGYRPFAYHQPELIKHRGPLSKSCLVSLKPALLASVLLHQLTRRIICVYKTAMYIPILHVLWAKPAVRIRSI